MLIERIRAWKRWYGAWRIAGDSPTARLPIGAEAETHDHINGFILKLHRFPMPRSSRCIVDVGANVGVCAIASSLCFPDATIHAFEPAAATFARLQPIANDRIRCTKAAVGASVGTATLHIAQNAFSSTLRPPDASCQELYGEAVHPTGATEEVPVTTLAKIIEENKFSRIDLLKVDVEGFEPQVLAGAGDYLRTHVHRIMMEASIARLSLRGVLDLLQTLERAGFVLANLDDVSRAFHLPNAPLAQFEIYLFNPALG